MNYLENEDTSQNTETSSTGIARGMEFEIATTLVSLAGRSLDLEALKMVKRMLRETDHDPELDKLENKLEASRDRLEIMIRARLAFKDKPAGILFKEHVLDKISSMCSTLRAELVKDLASLKDFLEKPESELRVPLYPGHFNSLVDAMTIVCMGLEEAEAPAASGDNHQLLEKGGYEDDGSRDESQA